MYLYTKEYLEDQIKICLAGCVAEELVCGSRSTGAANDFQRAFALARRLIESGMSELGIVSCEDLPRAVLNRTLTRVISAQENFVRNYLKGQEERILKASSELVKRERISGDELRELLLSNDFGRNAV